MEKVRIDIMEGVEGNSIYINDYRVAGPKPWGGGHILKTYKVDRIFIEEALKQEPDFG